MCDPNFYTAINFFHQTKTTVLFSLRICVLLYELTLRNHEKPTNLPRSYNLVYLRYPLLKFYDNDTLIETKSD